MIVPLCFGGSYGSCTNAHHHSTLRALHARCCHTYSAYIQDIVPAAGALLQGWSGLDEAPDDGKSALTGPGAILVFLPGALEISKCQQQLETSGVLLARLLRAFLF